jgi:hypothetical protein
MTHSFALLPIILNENGYACCWQIVCVVMDNHQKSEHHNPLDYWCEQGTYRHMFLLCLYLCHSLCHWNRISIVYKAMLENKKWFHLETQCHIYSCQPTSFLILLHAYMITDKLFSFVSRTERESIHLLLHG